MMQNLVGIAKFLDIAQDKNTHEEQNEDPVRKTIMKKHL